MPFASNPHPSRSRSAVPREPGSAPAADPRRTSRRRSTPLVLPLLTVVAPAAGAQGALDPAWVPEDVYQETLWITPNGDPVLTGPMLDSLLGAGDGTYMHPSDPTFMGGGQHTKVGISVEIHYSRETEGPNADPDKHMRYYVNRGGLHLSLPLPPDVTSLNDLPDLVRFGADPVSPDDDLLHDGLAECSRVVAALEWARYLNLPISFQLLGTVSHGGQKNSLKDIDWFIESRGKDQCMWDVSDVCNPNHSDDPSQFVDAGAGWGSFSFATPTLADPDIAQAMGYQLEFRDLVRRNLEDAIEQLIAIGNLPRYQGRFVGIALDPEVHMPAHENLSTYIQRPFFEDYHPASIRGFAYYLKDRYGDSAPTVDSNGDGITFWSDFGTDYLAASGFGHDLSSPPATWEDLDAPRDYPVDMQATRSAFWQEWCNYHVDVVEGYLEELVAAAVDAGVPPSRIFTHQPLSNGSYHPHRVTMENHQWLDDWTHIEASVGMAGISMYQPYGVEGVSGGFNEKFRYFENLERRDESWGAPEFNPWIVTETSHATLADLEVVMRKAWETRAHVIWMHAWGDTTHQAVDVTTERWVWTFDPTQLSLEDPDTHDLWTLSNLDPIGSPPSALKATTQNTSYLQSPLLSGYDAADYPFVAVDMIAMAGASSAQPDDSADLRVEFESNGQWHMVTSTDLLRYDTNATQDFGVDLSAHPSYSGTITGLRLHPVEHVNAHAAIYSLALCGPNEFTTAVQNLLVAKQATPRPLPPSTVELVAPQRLDTLIPPFFGSEQLVVYGNDPVDLGAGHFPPKDFTDFGYLGNFEDVPVTCGGMQRDAILAPASNLIGQRKTGKFRRIRLPDLTDVYLRFGIGIQDGSTSSDGVRFRVLLRDHGTRELTEVFSEETRANAWLDREVDLTQWAGEDVDLVFETLAISDGTGDLSAWGEPKLVSHDVQARTWVADQGFGSVQGGNQWSYQDFAGGVYTDMTWVAVESEWVGQNPGCTVAASTQHPSTQFESCRVWTAPKSGTVDVQSTVHVAFQSSDGVHATMLHEGTVIWQSTVQPLQVKVANVSGVAVSEGDRIVFRVDSNGGDRADVTTWNPSVMLTWPGGY